MVGATTCLAHGGWKPSVQPIHPSVPYPYPKVVVPAQPIQTLTTYPVPMVYYQWTPYYIVRPIKRSCFIFPRWYTHSEPAIQWVYQPYYSN